MTPGM